MEQFNNSEKNLDKNQILSNNSRDFGSAFKDKFGFRASFNVVQIE